MPFLEPFIEILRHNMPSNTGEGHRTLTPLVEAEVELVILDPADTTDVFLQASVQRRAPVAGSLGTYSSRLASQMVRNGLCNRWLLRYAQHSSHAYKWCGCAWSGGGA